SRRRHTRFSRDWSSDVCSSDLSSTTRGTAKMTRKKILGVSIFVKLKGKNRKYTRKKKLRHCPARQWRHILIGKVILKVFIIACYTYHSSIISAIFKFRDENVPSLFYPSFLQMRP